MKIMNAKEIQDFFSGENEVELTDELISQLVKEDKWGDEASLKDMRDDGAKWNTKRNTVVLHNDFF